MEVKHSFHVPFIHCTFHTGLSSKQTSNEYLKHMMEHEILVANAYCGRLPTIYQCNCYRYGQDRWGVATARKIFVFGLLTKKPCYNLTHQPEHNLLTLVTAFPQVTYTWKGFIIRCHFDHCQRPIREESPYATTHLHEKRCTQHHVPRKIHGHMLEMCGGKSIYIEISTINYCPTIRVLYTIPNAEKNIAHLISEVILPLSANSGKLMFSVEAL